MKATEQTFCVTCKRSVAFLPVLFGCLFAGIVCFAPEISDRTAKAAVYALLGLFFIAVTVFVGRLLLTRITVRPDALAVRIGRRKERVYPYSTLSQLTVSPGKGLLIYRLYAGKRCIVLFTGEFRNVERLLARLSEKHIA